MVDSVCKQGRKQPRNSLSPSCCWSQWPQKWHWTASCWSTRIGRRLLQGVSILSVTRPEGNTYTIEEWSSDSFEPVSQTSSPNVWLSLHTSFDCHCHCTRSPSLHALQTLYYQQMSQVVASRDSRLLTIWKRYNAYCCRLFERRYGVLHQFVVHRACPWTARGRARRRGGGEWSQLGIYVCFASNVAPLITETICVCFQDFAQWLSHETTGPRFEDHFGGFRTKQRTKKSSAKSWTGEHIWSSRYIYSILIESVTSGGHPKHQLWRVYSIPKWAFLQWHFSWTNCGDALFL